MSFSYFMSLNNCTVYVSTPLLPGRCVWDHCHAERPSHISSSMPLLMEGGFHSISQYVAPLIIFFTRISRPGPFGEKQPQSMMFPPPCFTVGMVFFGCNSAFFVLQTRRVEFLTKSYSLVSSDHMTFSQSSSGSSKCSLANFRRAWTYTGLSRGTRLALQDLSPWRRSVLLMVTSGGQRRLLKKKLQCLAKVFGPLELCQSPDLNPIENLWKELKTAVHKCSPSNLTELELFCKEEWEKMSVSRSAKLIETYPKQLTAVIAAKGLGLLSMEKVGKMWSNLRSRCQTLFHTDSVGPSTENSVVEVDGMHCVVDLGRGGNSGEAQASRASSLPRSLLPLPMVTGGRRHNCVSDIPQIVEITIDSKDSEDARGGRGGVPVARRDSYSRHAPWGGKKKHSCSTKTQSSMDTDRWSGRARGAAGRRDRRYGVSSIQEMGDSGGGGRSLSARSLRQRLSDTVGLCLPLPPRRRSRSSKTPTVLKRKIHLTELMLETCPFPQGSDLANKWHLIKQHTAPVSPHSSTALLDAFDTAHPSPEDEEERLRERRRLSIEEGVDPPPNAQIHTLEALAQGSSLYKLGPKMAPGIAEASGEARGTAACCSGLADCDSEEDSTTLCLQALRPKQRHASGDGNLSRNQPGPWKVHTQIDYIHCLVPDLLQITALPCYWGVMDRYEAEALLDGRPEGTFLLRDSAQEDYLFSVSFRRYNRSLHARIEQWNHNFSFDAHDPCVFHSSTHLARAAICPRTTYDGIGGLPLPPALQDFLKEYHYKQKVRVRWLEREPPLKIK
ncbi:unnamed protein product [Oncorhynchus mykiss]|uniref:SH2 domain-containing protein n=1 Tax=Oncorhynchus mykiss TaxID=8022 RepID=A0A060WF33_ONCMY|nr:unnamed protein product [Oncorhynchus mykiss]